MYSWIEVLLYLTILELEGSDLDTSYSIRLPALKTLLLDRVGFKQNDGMFKFVLGCPSLEKLMVLNLVHQLRLQSTSLKFIQLGYRANIEPIQIEAINLESLILNGFIFENSNLSACKAIKNLSIVLAEYNFEDPSSLEDLISYFPHLENLTLDCDELTLENIKISNQQLRSLDLENCGYYSETDYRMVNVTVLAPKLTSFCYKGNISLTIVVESSDLLNGELVILDRPKKYDANWFTRMMNFL
uniref:F-box/LRR-repeat protein 15/At3g58940/PEG3-like LRR domain-containing protein n=1 Tax=Cannabis sativa TaxID=3483 RepID=A0A803NUI0_CANSA